MQELLTVSPSPHIRSRMTTQKIMGLVLLALVPAIVAATIVFGVRALFLIVFCGAVSVLVEWICRKLMKKENTIQDGSALLTGVLLALNVPATLPLWEAAIGCIVAIAVSSSCLAVWVVTLQTLPLPDVYFCCWHLQAT